jgi:hypothetical protein
MNPLHIDGSGVAFEEQANGLCARLKGPDDAPPGFPVNTIQGKRIAVTATGQGVKGCLVQTGHAGPGPMSAGNLQK